MHPELSTKQLDILKQIAPGISRIAVLWNAAVATKIADWQQLRPAANEIGVTLLSEEVPAQKISKTLLRRSKSGIRMHC